MCDFLKFNFVNTLFTQRKYSESQKESAINLPECTSFSTQLALCVNNSQEAIFRYKKKTCFTQHFSGLHKGSEIKRIKITSRKRWIA